jgi:hypothetical protein
MLCMRVVHAFVGWFDGSMYRGSTFSAWLVLGRMFHSTWLLCLTMDKGACSLGQCIFCLAGFQPVLQACLALFDLYTSYIWSKKKKETKWWRKWTHEIYTPTVKDLNDKNRI